jgi:WHEP-TRS domain
MKRTITISTTVTVTVTAVAARSRNPTLSSSSSKLTITLMASLLVVGMFLSRPVALAFQQGTHHRLAFRSSLQRHLFKPKTIADVSSWRQQRSIRLFSAATELSEQQKSELEAQIKAKGDEIRQLKETGADKSVVGPLVEELLALKAQLDPSILDPKNKPKSEGNKQQQNQQQKNQQNQQQQQQQSDDGDSESEFITARAVDYSKWYNDIIRVTGLAETSPVRGCMVIKPWGMSLWDKVRTELDEKIKEHGAENAYFPLLIPKSFLSKEAEHVDGFAKECAVVTHHRLTAGEGGLIADPEAELEDPLIIRPTSETMIWYMFRKWINSHRYVNRHVLSSVHVA